MLYYMYIEARRNRCKQQFNHSQLGGLLFNHDSLAFDADSEARIFVLALQISIV